METNGVRHQFELTVERVLPFNLFDTVIVFEGRTDDGTLLRFGVDHRPARELRAALEADEQPEVEVPGWAILGTVNEGD